MTNSDDPILSKLKKNHIEDLSASFQKHYQDIGGRLLNVIGIRKTLSSDNAYLGLILLNRIQSLTSENDGYYWGVEKVEQGSKRYSALKEFDSSDHFWGKKNYPLLEFIFGNRVAPLVKKAWDMVPTLMYQTGYSRRSFRGSGLPEIYFTNQLNFVIKLIEEYNYEFTLEEYAIHHQSLASESFSLVYGAAIDAADPIKEQLVDTIYGRHAQGKPNRAIIKGMLLSKNKDCWVAVEKLLLSAQRQEGLRQTILESLDETSIGAMKHFIKVVLDNKLTRFSSVVRAIDTWAGFGWEAEKETTVRRFLELADSFLNAPSEIEKAVKSQDNAEVYMALWAQGVLDVSECFRLIDKVLMGNGEKVSLALYFISQVGLSTFSIKYGRKYLDHEDLVIVCQAVELVNQPVFIDIVSRNDKTNIFNQMEGKLEYFPQKALTKSRVFAWLTFKYSKEQVLDLMINLLNLESEKDLEKIIPYFNNLSLTHREKVTGKVLPEYYGYSYNEKKGKTTLSKKKRDFAFYIIKDRSELVKSTAIRALTNAVLTNQEVEIFEGLLSRKSADFRSSAIKLILNTGVEQVKISAGRLLTAKSEDQRLAGLDLLLWLKKNSGTNQDWVNQKVKDFSDRPKVSSKEEVVLSGLQEKSQALVEINAENGFGIFDVKKLPVAHQLIADLSKSYIAEKAKNSYGLSISSAKVDAALSDLGVLVVENKDYEYTRENWNNTSSTELLGNDFSEIKKDTKGMSAEEIFCNYPLHDVWRKWFQDSGLNSRDIFLINLYGHLDAENMGDDAFSPFNKKLLHNIYLPKIPQISDYYWSNPVVKIIKNLVDRYPYDDKIDFLSEKVIDTFKSMDPTMVKSSKLIKDRWQERVTTWRDQNIVDVLWNAYQRPLKSMSDEQFVTYWYLANWRYLTSTSIANLEADYRPEMYAYARAYKLGFIEKDALYWRIMQPDAINDLTSKQVAEKYDVIKEFEFLKEMLEECRDKILEIELIRGDSSTPVTLLAQNINRLYGIENYIRLLKSLGNDSLHRGYIYTYGNHEHNKKSVLSTLLKNCFPSDSCTQKEFNQAAKAANISEKRLCDTATYAPQWLPYVAAYLGWKDMESAVWWLHAHTNGFHSSQTESEIAKYSSIEITTFREGAVDIAWFREVYKSLRQEKWKKLYNAAKYISDGSGHSRGLLYTDVIIGHTKIKEVTERITSKRNQDYLRVYGVIPLSKANPEKDLLKRYQFLQKFKKESKQFGSQRQASEGIAVRVAMENLARTAGYSDPIRLQWAMETKEARGILEDANKIKFDGADIKLEIDEQGKSSIVVIKEGKKLKSIPAKYKNDKGLLKLRGYNKTLREQYRRTKVSLQNAMVGGDLFTKKEIEVLMDHPVVAPLLKKLVLVSNEAIGFWKDQQLIGSDGTSLAVGEYVRLAHCVDLFEAKQWSAFQRHCFENKLVQPFKQIFRELYVPTQDELKEQSVSRRYAGHQVQPNKTVALLKGQGWTVDYDEGLQKVHHEKNTIARMFAMADWFSPSDIEAPTLETIEFSDRKTGKRKPFDQVDKRIFSETMRDIDLVVSVAHVGEVDPEASQSSIELRSVIVGETCSLFQLDNVTLLQSHAKIKGELGEYSVHLGSGVCHKVAGSSLSILPVHSQHRGRMFLPFIDDDPKTAEIVSKVLLLAKDGNIKDPTILSQL